MLTPQRQTAICDSLNQEGRVLAADLAKRFGVSEDTIRRDLRELANAGLCRRVYGGALPPAPLAPPLRVRRATPSDRLEVLALALAEVVSAMAAPGAVVFFDAGSTNLLAARALPDDASLTVVTHTPSIACALEERDGIEVVCLGGRLQRYSGACLGGRTMQEAAEIRPSLLVLGACAADAEIGITAQDFEEAEFKRFIAGRAGAVVSAATNDKLGSVSPFAVLDPGRLETLVVEHDAPHAQIAAFEAAGIRIVRARPPRRKGQAVTPLKESQAA